jgi:hypothetical protein
LAVSRKSNKAVCWLASNNTKETAKDKDDPQRKIRPSQTSTSFSGVTLTKNGPYIIEDYIPIRLASPDGGAAPAFILPVSARWARG